MKITTPESDDNNSGSNDCTDELSDKIKSLILNDQSPDFQKSDVKVNERGPIRNILWGQKRNAPEYERSRASLLFMSGGREIDNQSPVHPQMYPANNVLVNNQICIEAVQNGRQQHIDDLKVDNDEEAYYQKLQKICLDVEENNLHCNNLESQNILEDVLDMQSERRLTSDPLNDNATSQVLSLVEVPVCISVCQLPPNVTRKLPLICPKPELEMERCLQAPVSGNCVCNKKNDLESKHHKKFLEYARTIGLGWRDDFNRTLLIINIMNKKDEFAIYLVTKMSNCIQRKQFKRMDGIESLDLFINLCDNYEQTALFYAALYNLPNVIECLGGVGADPNLAETQDGNTPLHTAASRGYRYLGVVKQLCRFPKVDINSSNASGKTALHLAIQSHGKIHEDHSASINEMIDSRETIKHLLLNKAKLTIQDEDGKTPLHLAVEKGKVLCELIGVVQSHAVDWLEAVNLGDKNGFTALHMAAKLQTEESIQKVIIRQLLSRDAKSTVKDAEGRIPAQLVSAERKDIIHDLEYTWSQLSFQYAHI